MTAWPFSPQDPETIPETTFTKDASPLETPVTYEQLKHYNHKLDNEGLKGYLDQYSQVVVDFPSSRILITRAENYSPNNPRASLCVASKDGEKIPETGNHNEAMTVATALGDQEHNNVPSAEKLNYLLQFMQQERPVREIEHALEGINRNPFNRTSHVEALKQQEAERAKAKAELKALG